MGVFVSNLRDGEIGSLRVYFSGINLSKSLLFA